MVLTHVQLSGYRSHSNSSVNLYPYSCIIGRNDCGKSAFLRAIRLLLDPKVKPVAEDLTKLVDGASTAVVEGKFEDVPANWPLGQNGTLKIRRHIIGALSGWEVRAMVATDPLLRKMAVGVATRGEVDASETISAEIKAALSAQPGGRLSPDQWMSFYQLIDSRGLVVKGMDWGPISDAVLRPLFNVIFLAADSKAEEEIGGSKSVFDELGGMLVREAAKSSAEIAQKTRELQVLLDDLVKKDENGQWAYAPLNRMEQMLRNEIAKFDNDIELIHLPTSPTVGDHRFGMTLDVQDCNVRGIGNMGHGLRRSLVFAMLQTFAQMPEIVAELGETAEESAALPFEPFKVFLIEEPELYLHPQAERSRMIELQKLADRTMTQVVLCTHSAFFVDLQGHQSIVRFCRSGRTETRVYGWTGHTLNPGEKAWLNTLRFFDGGASSMLFSNCAVLCEGATEKLCVPALAQTLGIYDPSVEIVDCNGAGNIATYQKVLEALHVPYVIWLDGDEDNFGAQARAAQEINDLKANQTEIGSIVVNRHDWEDAAGIDPGRKSEKPLRSWTKFVVNNEPCTSSLEAAIRAVYSQEDLDLRTVTAQ